MSLADQKLDTMPIGTPERLFGIDPNGRPVLGSPAGGGHAILIASADASDAVKQRADYVCTGTDDNLVIQTAIDALPDAPDYLRPSSGIVVSGGKMGVLQFSGGWFYISDEIVIPPGSIVAVRGAGCTSWTPIKDVSDDYSGGTVIYSTDANGDIWHYPKYSGFPTTTIDLRDIEFRVLNPDTTTTTTGVALNLDGWLTGVVSNVNVLADLSVNTTYRIPTGCKVEAGSASSRKMMMEMNVYGFRAAGFRFSTTHLTALNLSTGSVSGDAFASGFVVAHDQDNYFAGLQAFGCTYGLNISSSALLPCEIQSIHFETCTTPVRFNGTKLARLRRVELDSGVGFTGDITDITKVLVDNIISSGLGFSKESQRRGTATILSGNTSVTVTHNLITTPTAIQITPKSSNGAAHWVDTIDSTSFAINVSGAVGSDTEFFWEAQV